MNFACPKLKRPESPFWVGTNDRMAAGDAQGCAKTTRCPSPATKMETDRWTPGASTPRTSRPSSTSARRPRPTSPLARHDRATQPPRRLSRTRRAGAIARAVAKLDQVRLDRCRLASFVGGVSVEVRRSVLRQRHRALPPAQSTDVHARVDGETLPRLRFLALQGNRLRAVAELGTLRHLALLDLSENPT